jgi:hypothetical protein
MYVVAVCHGRRSRYWLRRAWLADPAIRDFIGLSENSCDFNAPDGVPGFGSLITDDAGLLGTFGRVEIAVPRARLDTAEGKTTEWKSTALRAYQRRTVLREATHRPVASSQL